MKVLVSTKDKNYLLQRLDRRDVPHLNYLEHIKDRLDLTIEYVDKIESKSCVRCDNVYDVVDYVLGFK